MKKTIRASGSRFFLAAVILAVLLTGCGDSPRKKLSTQMKLMANEVNASCPMNIDYMTRLDNCISFGSDKFQYNYTIGVSLDDMSAEDIDSFRAAMQELIVPQVATNPEMKFFRDNKVSIAYYYKDTAGRFICDVVVTPDMYLAE